MTALQCFVPADSAAKTVGADELAAGLQALAAAQGQSLTLVRNGSHGLFWLEPLLEVVTPQGRLAYDPVSANDLADDLPAL